MNVERAEELLREYAERNPAPAPWEASRDEEIREKVLAGASPSGEPRPRVWRRRLLWITGALAAAAAVLLLARPSPPSTVGLQVDSAVSRTDLFRATRGPSRGERFYVGVDLDREAHLRLAVVDELGAYRLVAVDEGGATTLRAAPGRLTLGSYPLRADLQGEGDRRLRYAIAIASPDAIDEEALRGSFPDAAPSNLAPEALAAWSRLVRRRFGAAVEAVEVPRG